MTLPSAIISSISAPLLLATTVIIQSDSNAAATKATTSINDIAIHRTNQIMEGGQDVDWSHFLDRLLVDRKSSSRYHHVYSLRPDGQRLTTVTRSKLRGRKPHHNGSASWHPSGDYFVFTSQNPGDISYSSALPSIGQNCNLWLADRDGKTFWQLTTFKNRSRNSQGATSPHFSPDGKTLFWSGNTGQYPSHSFWGEHALYLADFNISNGKPTLGNIRKFQPGSQFDYYQSHGFSPDGNKVIFSANLKKKQPLAAMDIITYDRNTGALQNLTESPDAWDQFATYSPDGAHIAWASTSGFFFPFLPMKDLGWQRYLKSEIWIMTADGKRRKRLSFFNEPVGNHPESIGKRCYVSNMAWSPDGKKLAVCLHVEAAYFNIKSEIIILDLEDPTPQKGKPAATEPKDAPMAPPPPQPPAAKPNTSLPVTW